MSKLEMSYREPVFNDFDKMIAVSTCNGGNSHERFRYRGNEASVDSPKFRREHPELFLD